MMRLAIYDNPRTMRREWWINGLMGSDVSANTVDQVARPGDVIIPPWQSGWLEGDPAAVPRHQWPQIKL